jgi:NAD(P)-dependent dehydrogenase (short-subunit alcohol dehydrogenase family)
MRSVVVTGASRGLGLATAAHLQQRGWTVVATMRKPQSADDVELDVTDPDSIVRAAEIIRGRVGTPHAIVHNAGVTAVGTVEEMPQAEWEQIVSTNFLGPVRLTRELLPDMRAAGRGRIVFVSSESSLLGMPGIGAYGASKAALERWAESLSQEIAAFGLGVTVLVAGTFKTDILELTPTYGDHEGPYAPLHHGLETKGRRFTRIAADPAKFAPAVARALADTRPFVRRGVGIDAKLLMLGRRTLPTSVLQRIIRVAIGVPKPNSLRAD